MSNVDQYKEVLERCFDDIAALKKAHKESVEFNNDLLKENGSLQARIAALKKAVKDLAELAHRSHTYCEDSWYSCPMAEDGCANEGRGSECDCGAVEHNAKIDVIRSAAGYGGGE